MKPTVIDLFAGVGGLSLGFEKAGFDVLLANEYDPSIAEAYCKNHRNTKMIVGDITQLNLAEVFGPYINKIDVVIGGPPCQGFSQKGQRKTIHDERNFLFKYYVEVVRLVKPKYFVMENGVKPLWKTDYSQGIVVMAEDESDYFIVMECSSRNRGYKHTKIILTMGGCM